SIAGGGADRGRDVTGPIHADRRRLMSRDIVSSGGDLYIERDLVVGAVRPGIRIGSVSSTVDRVDVSDLGYRLTDRGEELVHVGLFPAAAELNYRDDSAAGNVGRGRSDV